jgi:hypothetical protein
VLSDGIASVSVFVEARPEADGGRKFATTATQVGSSAAFATESDGVRVTAVGEVPANTVRFIVGQVQQGVRAAANDVTPARLPTGPDALAPLQLPAGLTPGTRSIPSLAPRSPALVPPRGH